VKSKWFVAFSTAGLFSWVGDALAEGCCTNGTQDLTVQASVALTCTVATTPLAFGAYDPIFTNTSTAIEATGGLVIVCTDNYPATITMGQGQNPESASTDELPLRRMSDGASHALSYSLYQDAAMTIPWGNTFSSAMCSVGNITVYGRIPAGQNVPVGLYQDVVVVTVVL